MTEPTTAPTLVAQLREVVNSMGVLERRKDRLQKNITATDTEMALLQRKLIALQAPAAVDNTAKTATGNRA